MDVAHRYVWTVWIASPTIKMVTIREERPLSATEHDLDPGRSRPGFFLLAMALPAELVRVGLDGSGKIILRRRIQRKAIVATSRHRRMMTEMPKRLPRRQHGRPYASLRLKATNR
jgi:hypothetical protein